MRGAGVSAGYYCTAGGGMETFLLDEVKNKLKATEVEHIPGRVFFRCTSTLQQLMLLKSAERLFLLLRKAPPITLPKNPGVLLASYRSKAADVIKQSIVGNRDVWSHTLSTWTSLQAELNGPQGRGQKRKRDEGEKEENSSESGQSRPTFRVSCRCSGAIARCYNSQNLSRIIGVAISRQLGWKTDLRDPSIEVNVYLNDDHCVIGIPLLKHPLASRSYMKHTGLRSTVAWAMVSLCAVQVRFCSLFLTVRKIHHQNCAISASTPQTESPEVCFCICIPQVTLFVACLQKWLLHTASPCAKCAVLLTDAQ
uniref:THUMP domain containing 2 n=1 Tax=Astyanax mexicanus TaxID=7994 RepID=A0A8B9KZK2_ASTMX